MFLQGDLNSRTLLEGRGKDLLLEALAQWEINGGAGPVTLGWQQIRGNDSNRPTPKTSFEPLKKERFTKKWMFRYILVPRVREGGERIFLVKQ